MASTPAWFSCTKRTGKITAVERHALPNAAFGLPGQRKYEMPDPSHASNAKARSTQMYNRGYLTKRELDRIQRKANKLLKACPTTKGLGKRVHWNAAQVRKYREEVRKCLRRNKCSTRSANAELNCDRGCKASASRKVTAGGR